MENEYNERSEFEEEVKEDMGAESKSEEKKSGEQNYAYQNVIRNKTNSRAWSIVSFVLSILSVICCCSSWVSLILAVLSVAFAGYSRKNLGYFDGLSLAGLIIGIFGIVFAVMGIVSSYLFEDNINRMLEEFERYLENVLDDGSSIETKDF